MAESRLKYPGELYQPQWKFLKENFTEAEMKREYSRLRDIAQKRLKRMGENEFSRSATYEENVGKFPVLKEFTDKTGKITSQGDFAKTLAKLARFIESPLSGTRGQTVVKKKTIQSLHAAGYKFVNNKNYWDFVDFMEELDDRKLSEIYDSDRSVKLFRDARAANIPADVLYDDFEYFLENRQYFKQIDIPDKGTYSSKDLKRLIEDKKRGEDEDE